MQSCIQNKKFKRGTNSFSDMQKRCWNNCWMLHKNWRTCWSHSRWLGKNYFNLTIKVENQRVKIENKNKELFDITLEISPYLAYALGFTEELDLKSSSIFRINDSITSQFKSKLSVFTPKYLIICCDIVDDTIFSGEHVKLLRMVVNNTAESNEIISFEFLHHDFVPLGVKEFGTIHITITDVSGSPILTNSISPTYLPVSYTHLTLPTILLV